MSSELTNVESISKQQQNESDIAVAHLLQFEKDSKHNFVKIHEDNKVALKNCNTRSNQGKNYSSDISDPIKEGKQNSNEISNSNKKDDLRLVRESPDKTSGDDSLKLKTSNMITCENDVENNCSLQTKISNEVLETVTRSNFRKEKSTPQKNDQTCIDEHVKISQTDLLNIKTSVVDITKSETFVSNASTSEHLNINPDLVKIETVTSAHNLRNRNPTTVCLLKTQSDSLPGPQKALVIPMQGGIPHPSVSSLQNKVVDEENETTYEKEFAKLKSVEVKTKQENTSETTTIQIERTINNSNKPEENSTSNSFKVFKESTSILIENAQQQKQLEKTINNKKYQSSLTGYPPSLFYGSYPIPAPWKSTEIYSATACAKEQNTEFNELMIKNRQKIDVHSAKNKLNHQVNDQSETKESSATKELKNLQTPNEIKLAEPSIYKNRAQSVDFDQIKQEDLFCRFPIKSKLNLNSLSQGKYQENKVDPKINQHKSSIRSNCSVSSEQVYNLF